MALYTTLNAEMFFQPCEVHLPVHAERPPSAPSYRCQHVVAAKRVLRPLLVTDTKMLSNKIEGAYQVDMPFSGSTSITTYSKRATGCACIILRYSTRMCYHDQIDT